MDSEVSCNQIHKSSLASWLLQSVYTLKSGSPSNLKIFIVYFTNYEPKRC